MEKESVITTVPFGDRVLSVEYDCYEGKRICSTCGKNAIVFQIVEIKDSETGLYARDITPGKRDQLRRIIIKSLDDSDSFAKHCEECGAELELIIPSYFTEKWLKNSDKADHEASEKLEIAEASLNQKPPKRFF